MTRHWGHVSRRDLLTTALAGAGAAMLPARARALQAASAAADNGRILVVMELSGGNDGLNTVVPHGDDAYYRHRPNIGLKKQDLRLLDDHFGLSGGMAGFERLYRDGRMAIVHGCGYENPSFSHFTSMAYWHTAAPNRGEPFGWVGRLADAMAPEPTPNSIINIGAQQSLAVRAAHQVPVVFDDPDKFMREAFFEQKAAFSAHSASAPTGNASRAFLRDMADSAAQASALVRQAWADYSSPVDYGIMPLDLPKVAAMIAADLPTRLYYVSYPNNAFDTHVAQNDLHRRILTYTSDSVAAFMQDLARIGRADDVTLMIFSEFGRRVPENVSLGTDHGAANVMFVIGDHVKGGHYGQIPDLSQLDEGDNLPFTTDFRRVYSTMMQEWLGMDAAQAGGVLKGDFAPLGMIA